MRTVAADELWLSPSYGRDSLAIHFTWIERRGAVPPVVAAVEERARAVGARPHWGKLFGVRRIRPAGAVRAVRRLRRAGPRHDPNGKFRNAWLDRILVD